MKPNRRTPCNFHSGQWHIIACYKDPHTRKPIWYVGERYNKQGVRFERTLSPYEIQGGDDD